MGHRPDAPVEEAMVQDDVRGEGGNRLFGAMSPADWARLKPDLELIAFTPNQVIAEHGKPLEHVYFPLRGSLVSLSVDLKGMGTVEAATVGPEGVVGAIATGREHPSFCKASAQIAGPAVRIATVALQAAKEDSSKLRDVIYRYADALLAQLLQATACNAFHPVQQRLARWLLIAQDATASDELSLTQEMLAAMLDVHRSTVIRVAGPLQEQGIIRYVRGRITIVDRTKLEQAACECYWAVQRHYARVLPIEQRRKPRSNRHGD